MGHDTAVDEATVLVGIDDPEGRPLFERLHFRLDILLPCKLPRLAAAADPEDRVFKKVRGVLLVASFVAPYNAVGSTIGVRVAGPAGLESGDFHLLFGIIHADLEVLDFGLVLVLVGRAGDGCVAGFKECGLWAGLASLLSSSLL